MRTKHPIIVRGLAVTIEVNDQPVLVRYGSDVTIEMHWPFSLDKTTALRLPQAVRRAVRDLEKRLAFVVEAPEWNTVHRPDDTDNRQTLCGYPIGRVESSKKVTRTTCKRCKKQLRIRAKERRAQEQLMKGSA